MVSAEVAQHGFGVAHLEGAGLLDVQRRDDAVLDQHRIALRTQAEAALAEVELEADSAGEVGAAVGHHQHRIADAPFLAPGSHDEGVR